MEKITVKLFLISAFSTCMFVLSGCMSLSEPAAPALKAKFATEAKLHLDGFQLYSIREKQYNTGYAYSTGYNFRTDSWYTGSQSYSGSTYERLLDDKFPGVVKDIFESSGYISGKLCCPGGHYHYCFRSDARLHRVDRGQTAGNAEKNRFLCFRRLFKSGKYQFATAAGQHQCRNIQGVFCIEKN